LDNKDSAKGVARKRWVHVWYRSGNVITGIHETGKVVGCCVRAFDTIFRIRMYRKTIEGVVANVDMIPVFCTTSFVIFIEVNRLVVASFTRGGTR
jgi:hypothetical protein